MGKGYDSYKCVQISVVNGIVPPVEEGGLFVVTCGGLVRVVHFNVEVGLIVKEYGVFVCKV